MARTVSTPSRGARGGVIGRPRIEPPVDAAARIESLAADSYSKIGIARKFDVCIDTLNEWMSEHEELKQAFDAGRAAEEFKLVRRLHVISDNADDLSAAVKATSYLLSTRHHYRDGGPGGGGGSNVRVVLELPAALTVDQFQGGKEPLEHGD